MTQLFALSDDHIAIRDMARDFADAKIAPHAIEWDEKKHFPVDVMRQAAELGMASIYVREENGGSGLGRLDAALIFEALAIIWWHGLSTNSVMRRNAPAFYLILSR